MLAMIGVAQAEVRETASPAKSEAIRAHGEADLAAGAESGSPRVSTARGPKIRTQYIAVWAVEFFSTVAGPPREPGEPGC